MTASAAQSSGRPTAPRRALCSSRTFNPGRDYSINDALGVVGETLLFNASDGVSGAELWKTDGTQAGTVLVKDINPGSAGVVPRRSRGGRRDAVFQGERRRQRRRALEDRRHRGRHCARQGHQPRKRILEPRSLRGDRGARCCSARVTASAVRSSGRPTAPRPALCSSRTSTPEAWSRPPRSRDGRRDAVFQGE